MVAALIIAAGKTKDRADFEPLKEVGAIPAIHRIIRVFQRAGIERIVVVCNDSDKPGSHMNAVYLPGKDGGQMLDNVKIGLSYLQDKCTAAMVTHVAVPLFSVETVRALMLASDGPVYVPFYRGRTGHPLFLRADYFGQILSYKGEDGLAGAVRASGLQRRFIEVEDEGVLVHVEDGSSYDHLLVQHSLRKSSPEIKIQIVREKPFYGPGAQLLLQLTAETGSLLEACRRMGISYSKGRKIIAIMEQQLEHPILESRQGGKDGGHSAVTEEGRQLMERYTAFCLEAKQCVHDLFEKYFTL